MSVSSIVGGGIRLVRTQPRTIAIWGALYLVTIAVAMMIFRPVMAELLAEQHQAAANAAAGMTTPPSFHAGMFAGIFIAQIVFGIIMVILFAAVVRAVAQPGGDRFAYLRVGMDELRLIGLVLLFVLAAIVAEIVAIILLLIIGGLLALVIGKAGGVIIAVIMGCVLFGAAIYAQVRLSLAGALTVIRRRIVIKDAWHATKGRFWTLFGVYLLIWLAFLIITIVITALTHPHLLVAYASFDAQAINAVAQEQLAQQGAGLSIGLIVQMLLGAVLFTAVLAVAFGAVATAALELGEPASDEV